MLETNSYTVKELANWAGVQESYIRQLIIGSKLSGIKRGGVWFIPAQDAEAWIKGRLAHLRQKVAQLEQNL